MSHLLLLCLFPIETNIPLLASETSLIQKAKEDSEAYLNYLNLPATPKRKKPYPNHYALKSIEQIIDEEVAHSGFKAGERLSQFRKTLTLYLLMIILVLLTIKWISNVFSGHIIIRSKRTRKKPFSCTAISSSLVLPIYSQQLVKLNLSSMKVFIPHSIIYLIQNRLLKYWRFFYGIVL